jgi:uncharacterized phiE125 gp8 family phage protein
MLVRSTIDRTILPADLLDTAKAHIRVEHDRDDAQIEKMIARAVDAFERLSEFKVNPQTWTWAPSSLTAWRTLPAGGTGWRIPVQPVSGFTAVDADAQDVAASFAIVGILDPDQFADAYMTATQSTGIAPAGVTFTLTAGFATAADVPPGIEDGILNAVGDLYEKRETAAIAGVDLAPYINRWFAGYWLPRC